MKAVLMAGGRGTRIQLIASDIPKPMIPIGGKPVLEHEVDCLRKQGITDLIITVSHLQAAITDYFGDGSRFGVSIRYFYEPTPLGNAGALYKLRNELTEDFLLLNADVMLDVDFTRMLAYHEAKCAAATVLSHPNSHPYDSGLIVADKNGAVTQWLSKDDPRPEFYKNCVNAGVHILSPAALDFSSLNAERIDRGEKVDLDRHILKPMAGSGTLYRYSSPEFVMDMGTPDRYRQVQQAFLQGKIEKRNLRRPQRAVFLDRDGTINKYVGFLRDIHDFELLPGVSSAVRAINEAGYLCIVVTNQPIIARGEVSVQELEEIHNKMETLLGYDGAYLDAIYYCPHHPHKGYAKEIAELKIECNCRKPRPGMLLQAAKEFHIDLAESWMVGDCESDILAGKNAGCKTCLLGRGDFGQDISKDSLLEFTSLLG